MVFLFALLLSGKSGAAKAGSNWTLLSNYDRIVRQYEFVKVRRCVSLRRLIWQTTEYGPGASALSGRFWRRRAKKPPKVSALIY